MMRHHELSKQGMWVRPNPAGDVRRLNAEKVVDIGCGNGRHMIFPVSVGLDNDPRAVAKARHRGPCVLGDAHHLPFRNVFDIALLWGVLNFVELTRSIQKPTEYPNRTPFIPSRIGLKTQDGNFRFLNRRRVNNVQQ